MRAAGLRVCVFGASAIGGHLAGRLARGGAQVSVVARGAPLDAIRARGLTVHAPDAAFHAMPRATDDPREVGPQDAVVVTVKAPPTRRSTRCPAPRTTRGRSARRTRWWWR